MLKLSSFVLKATILYYQQKEATLNTKMFPLTMNFNLIPNVDESNNIFYIDNHELALPKGTFEI